MNDDQFVTLYKKLDFISKILLLNIVNKLDFKEQVTRLHMLELKEIEIARLLNSSRDKIHHIVRNLK